MTRQMGHMKHLHGSGSAKRGAPTDRMKLQSGGIEQWIDYVRYSLADILVRGEWDDFGIFRFLNRISFLFTKQLIFIISHTERNHVEDEEITAYDKVYKKYIIKHMIDNGLIVEDKSIFYIKYERHKYNFTAKFEYYKIRVFDTNNFIICFEIKPIAVIDGQPSELKLNPIKRSSTIGKFLERVLRPFDGKGERMHVPDNVESRLDELRKKGNLQESQGHRTGKARALC